MEQILERKNGAEQKTFPSPQEIFEVTEFIDSLESIWTEKNIKLIFHKLYYKEKRYENT